MSRRTNREGTVYFNAKRNEYVGCIRYGMKPDGSPNRVTFYSGKDGKKSDVIQKMTDWRLRHEQNYAETHKVRLEDGIMAWAETCKKPDLKPSAYDRLESIIKCQIIPRIGWYYLTELADSMIQSDLISEILEKDGLSVSTAKKAYNALNEFLKYSVHKKEIPSNPMAMMKAPKPSSTIELDCCNSGESITGEKDKALSREETEKLRSILYSRWKIAPQNRRYPNGGAMELILNTGLRLGEALALQWSDVNWKKNTISVSKNLIRVKNRSGKGKKYKLILQEKPKTEKSKRIIPLNKAALAALEDLKTAPGYKPDGFIIHTNKGTAVLPRTLEQTLENMCAAVGIRKVGVHALRHTYATRLFEKGVDIKIISELLGHSSTEITYRIYVHVIDSLKESAVEALDLD